MHEIAINLHIHSRYSDGSGSHKDIAQAAMRAGLEAVIVSDHNVLVQGLEGYYRHQKQRTLVLIGQEVHDQERDPQKNHLLVFGADRDLATFADNPQTLVNAVKNANGLSFIAHPFETASPVFNEPDISWVNWDVEGFTGIELWNGMSEMKEHLSSIAQGILFGYFPELIAHGPRTETLQRWDEYLLSGKHIVAVGGSDAHAFNYQLGPLRKVIFPYHFHFSTINTHLLLAKPLSGELNTDRQLILDALKQGHVFIGYDLPASTRGFRFTAQGRDKTAFIGDEIPAREGVTIQIRLPSMAAECRLIHNGAVIRTWKKAEICSFITTKPGYYRVEAYRRYLGQLRGWIYSNPIFIK
ncbi:MAG: CehA/McbA family metallohydrolase [Anaerolineales bacterium]|nr:CehA/McbA family metallohydrolase [Anaerolineales bacterium]